MVLGRIHLAIRRNLTHVGRQNANSTRSYSEAAHQRSAHAQFYSEMVPGMIPVALLGSAVYLGLRLLQANLSHERYLDEAREKVRELEGEVERLRLQQISGGANTSTPTNATKQRGWLW